MKPLDSLMFAALIAMSPAIAADPSSERDTPLDDNPACMDPNGPNCVIQDQGVPRAAVGAFQQPVTTPTTPPPPIQTPATMLLTPPGRTAPSTSGVPTLTIAPSANTQTGSGATPTGSPSTQVLGPPIQSNAASSSSGSTAGTPGAVEGTPAAPPGSGASMRRR